MAQDHHRIPPRNTDLTTTSRWPLRRRLSLRRRKPPIIRLGGEKPRRRRMLLLRMLRGTRLRWLKLRYLCMFKKLKECYRNFIKDLPVSGVTIEAYQQRLLMETSFAVPGMGITFSNFLSVQAGSNPSRSFMA
ncbi:PREDICTED: uncharacterized protein LOC105133431 [Populus euphratica]|uniref:Uncharacterized protein LOC105133431 n=1 Tax=Populus euphratica TaxID=75702 RepID=A0AAJ6UTA8_POPEU|nr:PREDICTED: uncharacterized protein LOC105133431 [Populus euphratica]